MNNATFYFKMQNIRYYQQPCKLILQIILKLCDQKIQKMIKWKIGDDG